MFVHTKAKMAYFDPLGNFILCLLTTLSSPVFEPIYRGNEAAMGQLLKSF